MSTVLPNKTVPAADGAVSLRERQSAILDRPEQIAAFRLNALEMAFRTKANTGMSLARNMPRVADVAAQYKLGPIRTVKQLAAALGNLRREVENGEAGYELRDGLCHFYPGPRSL